MIKKIILKMKSKKFSVCVIGLGYVGLPLVSRFIKSFITRRGFEFGGLGVLIGILCAIYPYVSAIKCKEDRINF